MSRSTVEVNLDNARIVDGVLKGASITRKVTFVGKSERQDPEKGPDFTREVLLQISADGLPLESVLTEMHKSETISLRGWFRDEFDSKYCTRYFDAQPTEMHNGEEMPLLAWSPEQDKRQFFSMPKSTEEVVEEATKGKSQEEIDKMIALLQKQREDL